MSAGDKLRICVVSERLGGALDEGVKKFAFHIGESLGVRHQVHMISTEAYPDGRLPGVEYVPSGRHFLSPPLASRIASSRPDLLFYVARSSVTTMSVMRAALLKRYGRGARVALVSLQDRRDSWLRRETMRRFPPDLVFVQSLASLRDLSSYGLPAEIVCSGVDLERFQPVPASQRTSLRHRYGLRPHLPVVLHVGHLKTGRGIDVLAELSRQGGCQVVLVTSSSTHQNATLGEDLRRAGVIVCTEYQPNVEHFYQLADCYVFPVVSTDDAIGAPLSVLEALGCGLPVVSTPFGALPHMFQDRSHTGITFAETREALCGETVRAMVAHRDDLERGAIRALALPYSWEAIADRMVTQVLERSRSGG